MENKGIIRLMPIVKRLRRCKAYRTLENFYATGRFVKSLSVRIEMCLLKIKGRMNKILERISKKIKDKKGSSLQKWYFYGLVRKFLPVFGKAYKFISS